MNVRKRFDLIKEVGEEVITDSELLELLNKKKRYIAYDGFEPSGHMHIAQGILRAINVNKMIESGAKFKMLVADWHAWANNKFGGDLEKIQTAGKYFIEVWKACGMDLDSVEFVFANELVDDTQYWKIVMGVARNNTLSRIIRCSQIMGRNQSDILSAAQIFYPCMQCADIFYLKADVTQLGMDQRRINVLAREIGPFLGFYKPVVVSHHMLMGLLEPKTQTTDLLERAIELKMSKSNPASAIFMTDSSKEIKEKISKAYCPAKIVDENPILEYCKYIIFERFDKLKIERTSKFGGDLEIASYHALRDKYQHGEIHPLDLKNAVAIYVDKLIDPVRSHFEKNKRAADLLLQVSKFEVTR